MGMITRPWWSEANGERLVSFKHFYIDILFRRNLFSAHAHTMSKRAVCCQYAQSMQVEINTHYDDWQKAILSEAQIDSDGELK